MSQSTRSAPPTTYRNALRRWANAPSWWVFDMDIFIWLRRMGPNREGTCLVDWVGARGPVSPISPIAYGDMLVAP